MVDGSTRLDRNFVLNSILAVNEETNMVFFDVIKFKANQDERRKVIGFFNMICCSICFLLGTFQLTQTVSANIKDSMWELGVLRSMGCTRTQITRVMVYEMCSNTMSALTLGYFSGISVSILTIAQFHIIVELPLSIDLPTKSILGVGCFTVFSMIMGAKYGTSILYSKNISSILKG